jgi:hypothetical protein
MPPPLPGELPNDGTGCNYNVADANLAPLGGQGGPNNLPVHMPNVGSPVLDAMTLKYGGDPIDQRGTPIPQDGNGDGSLLFDRGACEREEYLETESLTDLTATAPHVVDTAAGYHGGKGTNLQAGGVGQFVAYHTPGIINAGNYRVVVGFKKAANAGMFRLSAGNAADNTPVNIGGQQDTFAPTTQFTSVDLGLLTVMTSTQKYFRFSDTGKNGSSSGYQLFPDYIRLVKQP